MNVVCYERVCYEKYCITFLQKSRYVLLVLYLRQLYLAHVAEYLSENFSTMGYCFFYSSFFSLIQYVIVKHVTIFFDPLMSLGLFTHWCHA